MRDNEFRAVLAAHIAGGLVSAHGVDHGGVKAELIAERSLAIVDAILEQCEPAVNYSFGDAMPEPSPVAAVVEVPVVDPEPAEPVAEPAPVDETPEA